MKGNYCPLNILRPFFRNVSVFFFTMALFPAAVRYNACVEQFIIQHTTVNASGATEAARGFWVYIIHVNVEM